MVKSAIEIDQVMQSGKKNRSVGSTLMNASSSRSHSIFTIVCECAEDKADGSKPSIRVGKLNLVDLAGSERQSKTGATGIDYSNDTYRFHRSHYQSSCANYPPFPWFLLTSRLLFISSQVTD